VITEARTRGRLISLKKHGKIDITRRNPCVYETVGEHQHKGKKGVYKSSQRSEEKTAPARKRETWLGAGTQNGGVGKKKRPQRSSFHSGKVPKGMPETR